MVSKKIVITQRFPPLLWLTGELTSQKPYDTLQCSGILDKKEMSAFEQLQTRPRDLFLHHFEIDRFCNPIITATANIHGEMHFGKPIIRVMPYIAKNFASLYGIHYIL